jgi:hypothetical protein
MRFLKHAAIVAAVTLIAAAGDRAFADEPIEIFDAHLHYNWEPKPFYQLDEVLALFKKHRITGILATSRPNTGTHALMDAKAEGLQVVPFIRPYRVRADIGSWFNDPVIFDLVRDEFKRGYYRGIGEFHLSGKAADTEMVKKTVDLAVANNLYLHAHADDEAVEILMRHNPRAKVIWAHTGFGLGSDRVAAMLAKYPKLWGELSCRGGIVDGSGKLTPEWRAIPTASCSAPIPGCRSAGLLTARSWRVIVDGWRNCRRPWQSRLRMATRGGCLRRSNVGHADVPSMAYRPFLH